MIEIDILDGSIEECRELCNELMAHQKAQAVLLPEVFDTMNFDTRMKASYAKAKQSQVIVVKDDGKPVGYAFSTIDAITSADANLFPDWAPSSKDSLGFYPLDFPLPATVGCINNLYLKPAYRNLGLGKELLEMAMDWLTDSPTVNTIFVYVSNGNKAALDFYLKNGFTYSHEVFGGFIQAAIWQDEE